MAGVSKDNTGKVFSEAEQIVIKMLEKAAVLVERDAKILCPVKTGTLKRSITHEIVGSTTAIVGTNVEYAPHVEIGTHKMSAKPFLMPALEMNVKKIMELLKKK